MEKFEYKTIRINRERKAIIGLDFINEVELHEQLNMLGGNGWELVNVIPYAGGGSGGATSCLYCIFKRKIQE